MSDSVQLLVNHLPSRVGAVLAASFSFPLLFDLLGAMQKSTRRFNRIHSEAPVVRKKNANQLRDKDIGGDLGVEAENLKYRSSLKGGERKMASGGQSSG
jgi:hypothetical protein